LEGFLEGVKTRNKGKFLESDGRTVREHYTVEDTEKIQYGDISFFFFIFIIIVLGKVHWSIYKGFLQCIKYIILKFT
jgi:hypothetical protein